MSSDGRKYYSFYLCLSSIILLIVSFEKKLTTFNVFSRGIALLRTYTYKQEAARIFISVSKTDARTLFDNILSKRTAEKTPL